MLPKRPLFMVPLVGYSTSLEPTGGPEKSGGATDPRAGQGALRGWGERFKARVMCLPGLLHFVCLDSLNLLSCPARLPQSARPSGPSASAPPRSRRSSRRSSDVRRRSDERSKSNDAVRKRTSWAWAVGLLGGRCFLDVLFLSS